MNKAIKIIREISDWITVFLFILIVGFFVFQKYKNFITIPLPVSIEIQHNYTNIVAISFIVVIPLVLLSNFPDILRLILFILITPASAFFLFISPSFSEEVIASYKLESQNYHVSARSAVDAPLTHYLLYECDIDDLYCKVIYGDEHYSLEDVFFAMNKEKNQLYIFRSDSLWFVEGTKPHKVIKHEQFGGFTYYMAIYSFRVDGDNNPFSAFTNAYFLYKCKNTSVNCQQLPIQYIDSDGVHYFNLVFDEITNELKFYKRQYEDYDLLIYIYGTEPKCYVENCNIPTE